MYLDIIESEGKGPSLKDVGFMDPNSLHIPLWLEHDPFLSYGYLGFKVNGIEPNESIRLSIGYPDRIHDETCLYAYQGPSLREKRDFALQDTNIISITLQDGGAGDSDGEVNGIIDSVFALYNTGTIEMEAKERGCFILCITKCITKKNKTFHKKKDESFHKGKGR